MGILAVVHTTACVMSPVSGSKSKPYFSETILSRFFCIIAIK